MQDNDGNTIVLDMRKVTSKHFKAQHEELCTDLHVNSDEENAQLEKDLSRSKIIIDANGTRTTCSSIAEFKAASTILSEAQKQYILNVGHQGLFGGGSAFIPTQYIAAQHQILVRDARNRDIDDKGNITLTPDAPLCVSIKGGNVTLTNTIDFHMILPSDQEKKLGSLTLSMVADITNLVESRAKTSSTQIQEMPIYMAISHKDKPADVDIIKDFRTLEGGAEVTSPIKTNVTDFIQQVRDDKTHDNIMHGQNTNALIDIVEELSRKSLDNSKSLEKRQENLDNILGQSTFAISGNEHSYEIAAKILSTRASPDKDQIRLHYAAHAITKYTAGFDNQTDQKPSPEVVSRMFGTIIEDEKTKQILQKNSAMILRHTTDHKNLSRWDRVKKVLDKISMVIRPEKRVAQSFAAKILAEREKTQRSFGR